LYDALIQSLSLLEAAGQRRQILVLVGGAENGGSRLAFGALEHRMSMGPAVFFAAGLHPGGGRLPVDSEEPGPVSEMLESAVSARWGLTRLAAMTGGLALFSRRTRELGPSLLRIADQLRHHYLLEYHCPLASGAARFHPIEVRLKNAESVRDITVRSRRAYLR
jgi:hypothetical protein